MPLQEQDIYYSTLQRLDCSQIKKNISLYFPRGLSWAWLPGALFGWTLASGLGIPRQVAPQERFVPVPRFIS